MTYFVEACLWVAVPWLVTYATVTQIHRAKERSRR